MSDVIVSHIASPEYRASVDRMGCAMPGCKRWRTGDTEFCEDHELEAGEALMRGAEALARPVSRDVEAAKAKRRERMRRAGATP